MPMSDTEKFARALNSAASELRRTVRKIADENKVPYDALLFHLLIDGLAHFEFEYYDGEVPKKKW